MSEERKTILNMIASGKISANEAEELLMALDEKQNEGLQTKNEAIKAEPRFLNIRVSGDGKKDNVNVKIPLGLLKGGMKIASFMPSSVVDKVKSALGQEGNSKLDLNSILANLSEFSVDVEDGDEKIKIFCE